MNFPLARRIFIIVEHSEGLIKLEGRNSQGVDMVETVPGYQWSMKRNTTGLLKSLNAVVWRREEREKKYYWLQTPLKVRNLLQNSSETILGSLELKKIGAGRIMGRLMETLIQSLFSQTSSNSTHKCQPHLIKYGCIHF